MKKIAWEAWVDFDPEINDTNLDEEEDSLEIVPIMVRTPLGPFSPYEQMSPNKMFDCWICHTNFDLTPEHKDLLDQVPGIEVLVMMSRYRFFIGLGKLFTLKDIIPYVEDALSITPICKETEEKIEKLNNIINQISGKEKWAVAIYKDGTCKTITSEKKDDSQFDEELVELEKSSPENIIKSTDY